MNNELNTEIDKYLGWVDEVDQVERTLTRKLEGLIISLSPTIDALRVDCIELPATKSFPLRGTIHRLAQDSLLPDYVKEVIKSTTSFTSRHDVCEEPTITLCTTSTLTVLIKVTGSSYNAHIKREIDKLWTEIVSLRNYLLHAHKLTSNPALRNVKNAELAELLAEIHRNEGVLNALTDIARYHVIKVRL